MRTIQEIFDAVITAGYYGPRIHNISNTPYMCHALVWAVEDGSITEAEKTWALEQIHEYLHGFATLFGALIANKLPNFESDRWYIYQHWSTRPRLRFVGLPHYCFTKTEKSHV